MIKIKPLRQTPGFCGPASLKMVFEYYGVSISEAEIARISGATRERGATSNGLIKVARKFGFKAFFKERSSLKEIKSFIKKKIPVIIDWFSEDEGHYSVVADIDNKNITLIDPEFGRKRKIPLEKFLRIWFDFPGDYLKNCKEIVLRAMLVVMPKNN